MERLAEHWTEQETIIERQRLALREMKLTYMIRGGASRREAKAVLDKNPEWKPGTQ